MRPQIVETLTEAGCLDAAWAAFEALDPRLCQVFAAAASGDLSGLRHHFGERQYSGLLAATWLQSCDYDTFFERMLSLNSVMATLRLPRHVRTAVASGPFRAASDPERHLRQLVMRAAAAGDADVHRAEVLGELLEFARAHPDLAVESTSKFASAVRHLCASGVELPIAAARQLTDLCDAEPPLVDLAASCFSALPQHFTTAATVADTIGDRVVESGVLSSAVWDALAVMLGSNQAEVRFRLARMVADGKLRVAGGGAWCAPDGPLNVALWAAAQQRSLADCAAVFAQFDTSLPSVIVAVALTRPPDGLAGWVLEHVREPSGAVPAAGSAELLTSRDVLFELGDDVALALAARGLLRRPALLDLLARPTGGFAARFVSMVLAGDTAVADVDAAHLVMSSGAAPDVDADELAQLCHRALATPDASASVRAGLDLATFLFAAADALGDDAAAWQTLFGLVETDATLAVADLLDVSRLTNTS